MDNNNNTPTSGTPGTPGANDPREDLREQLQLMGRAAQDLLEQLVRVPATLAQIPLQALPEDTATHARNAASEGFAAVRSLVDSMSRGIDDMMKAQRDRMNAQRDTTAASRDLGIDESPSMGGHGTGAGPSGMGMAGDSASRDLGADAGNTIRLDEEP